MTTLEEKQNELDALQEAFDEYIVSSRELEEELEADFTMCRELFCYPLTLFVSVLLFIILTDLPSFSF